MSTPSPASINTIYGEFDAELFSNVGVVNFVARLLPKFLAHVNNLINLSA
jgi:hypothetical protein